MAPWRSRQSAVLYLLLAVIVTSSGAYMDAVLTVAGERRVVMVMDMAAPMESRDTGSGEHILPVLLAAVNMVQRLQQDNVSIGLSVYDVTHRPVSAVVRLMAGLVAQGDTTPAVVITLTSPTLASALSDLLRHTEVPHIRLDLMQQTSSAAQDTHVYLSSSSSARVKATMRLLEELDMHYFDILVLRNPIAQNEASHFRQLARQSDTLCSAASLDVDNSIPTVVFTGDDDDNDDGAGDEEIVAPSGSVVMVVGDGVSHVVVDSTWQTVLWLQETVDVSQSDLDAMLHADVPMSVSSLNTSACAGFHMDASGYSFASPSPPRESCVVTLETVRHILAVRDTLDAIAAEGKPMNKSNIAMVTGNPSQSAEATRDGWESTPEPAWTQEELSVAGRARRFRLQVHGGVAEHEDEDSTTVYNFSGGTITILTSLLRRDVSSQCDVNCHLCDVCTPKVTSDERVMVPPSVSDKTLLIVGLFPVHTSGTLRDTACGEANTVGLAAAQAFLSAVENHKNRTPPRRLRGISLGGVVLDSCGDTSQTLSVMQQVDTCFASYTDVSGEQVVISPAQVIAYTVYHSVLVQPDERRLVLSVTDAAYGFGVNARLAHAAQMAKVLAALNWTFVKIVISQQDSLIAHLKTIFQSQGVCAEMETVEDSAMPVATATRLVSESTGVVFLTDPLDTRRLMHEVASLNASARMKYFLSSWNWELAHDSDVTKIAELVVVTLPTLARSVDFHAGNVQFNNPWAEDFPSLVSGELRMEERVRAVVTQAVDSMITELDAAYRELCPQQKAVCEKMSDLTAVRDKVMTRQREAGSTQTVGLDILMLHAATGHGWTQVGEVNSDGRVILSNNADIIPASFCPGWCPQCLACPSLPPPFTTTTTTTGVTSLTATNTDNASPLRPTIYIPGEILVAAVLPLRRAGSRPFQCGVLNGDAEEKRAEEAFLFAVETAQQRYSTLLPHVTVGGILLDSCSDLPTVLHMLGQFQSCSLTLDPSPRLRGDYTGPWGQSSVNHPTNGKVPPFSPSPALVVGYVIQDEYHRASVVRDAVRGLNKMAVVTAEPSLSQAPETGHVTSESPSRLAVEAVLSLFTHFQWTHVLVLASGEEGFVDMAEYLVGEIGSRGVCVVKYLQLMSGGINIDSVAAALSQPSSTSIPVVVFLPRADAVTLFRDREVGRVSRPWVISMIGDDWLSTVGVNIPWGALLIDVQGKVNDDFQVFLEQFSALEEPLLAPWWRSYLQMRHRCQPATSSHTAAATSSSLTVCEDNPLMTSSSYPSATASRVIRGVDSILHALDARYKLACHHGDGICRNLSRDILKGRLSLADASFRYEGGPVSFTATGHMDITLSVLSYQPGRLVTAGTYRFIGLSLNTSSVLFYSTSGQPLATPTAESRCPECMCINLVANITRGDHASTPSPPLALSRDLWWAERGVFMREVWTWSVLALAVGGALISMFFIFYVLFKVWQGALARRYIGLGLVLLVSLMLLYLACLPFLFTPSPSVCGLRYLYPACAHCLVLACMLVKLMSLQDYRRIGLGGELSGVNQGLSVFFILLVQVSVSVLWWIFKTPFLQSDLDPHDRLVKHACRFDPRDFVQSQSFVIFLILLCAVYSVAVRNEKKNMGEAKLLLACCWILLILWLGWLPSLWLLDDRYASVIACGGILATASVVLLVVFVPKVRLVSRLKYDLARKQAARNGYSIDTDFLYERPYSLPGTLTSTYSSIRTHPKSLTANFDSSLSY